jgi:hypothetical protein
LATAAVAEARLRLRLLLRRGLRGDVDVVVDVDDGFVVFMSSVLLPRVLIADDDDDGVTAAGTGSLVVDKGEGDRDAPLIIGADPTAPSSICCWDAFSLSFDAERDLFHQHTHTAVRTNTNQYHGCV